MRTTKTAVNSCMLLPSRNLKIISLTLMKLDYDCNSFFKDFNSFNSNTNMTSMQMSKVDALLVACDIL
jgi:hypothetical protein